MKRLSLLLSLGLLFPFLVLSQSCPHSGLTANISGTGWPFPILGLSAANPIDRDLIIPAGQTWTLNGTDLFFADGALLIVESGSSLNLSDCTFFSCDEDETWGGIRAGSNSTVSLTDSRIFNAEKAIHATAPMQLTALRSIFRNPSESGIYLEGNALSPSGTALLDSCVFHFSKDASVPAFPDIPTLVKAENWSDLEIVDCEFLHSSPATIDPQLQDRCTGIDTWNTPVDLSGSSFKYLGQACKIVWEATLQDPFSPSKSLAENQFLNCLEGVYLENSWNVLIRDNLFGLNANRDRTVDASSLQIPSFVGFHSRFNVQYRMERNQFIKQDEDPGLLPASYTGAFLEGDGDLQELGGFFTENEFKFRLPDQGSGSYPGIANIGVNVIGLTPYYGPPAFYPDPYYFHCNFFNLDDDSAQDQTGMSIAGFGGIILGESSSGIYNAFTPGSSTAPGMQHIICFLSSIDLYPSAGSQNPDPALCSNIHFMPIVSGPICPYAKTAIQAKAPEWKVFPNPAVQGPITFHLQEPTGSLSLTNAQGQCVWTLAVRQTEIVLPTAQFPAGLYYAKWDHSTGREIQKIRILH